MKKVFITLVVLSTFLNAQATENKKPVKGTFTTQIGLSLATWSGNISSMGLNGRYFINSGLAARLSAMTNNYSYTNNYSENPDGSGGQGSYNTTTKSTVLMLGLEKHFRGNSRLSPYIGIEVGTGPGNTTTKGDNSSGFNYRKNYSEEGSQKSTNVQLGTFLGFDYWVAEGIYLGIEYKFFSYSKTNNKNGETNITDNGVQSKVARPGNQFILTSTTNVVPSFRLGWKF